MRLKSLVEYTRRGLEILIDLQMVQQLEPDIIDALSLDSRISIINQKQIDVKSFDQNLIPEVHRYVGINKGRSVGNFVNRSAEYRKLKTDKYRRMSKSVHQNHQKVLVKRRNRKENV